METPRRSTSNRRKPFSDLSSLSNEKSSSSIGSSYPQYLNQNAKGVDFVMNCEEVVESSGRIKDKRKVSSEEYAKNSPMKKTKNIEQQELKKRDIIEGNMNSSPAVSITEEFIEKQRAYYKEVDAYELIVEFFSESDLE